MRKAIIQIGAFAASILLFSCTDKQLGEPAANNLVQKELTFEANIAEAGTKTSVTMNDSQITGVLWSPSDEINLFFVNSTTALSSGKFSNVAEVPAQTTSFSGTIGVITGSDGSPVADQCFWALYPYAEGNTYTDQTVSFTLSDKQESAANSFSDGQWPTMAKSAGLNLPFYAICSGIKFKVKQEGVKSVTFKTNNGELINGTVVAGWDGNNLPTASISEGTDETVVTPKGGGTFDTSAYYFVTFPAVTMTGGLTVTYKTATQQCIVPKTSSLTFNRNELGTAVDLDNDYVDLPATKYYKASVIEEGYDYLVVSNGYALKNNNGTPAAVEVTDVDNVITLFEEDASILWTAGKPETTITEGTYTFTNDGKSFYRYSDNLGIETPESITKYYLWDYKDNHITHMGSSNYYYWIKYDKDSSTWSLGYAKTIPSTNPSYLYNTRLPQTLAFTGTKDAEIDLADEVKTFQATLTGEYHTTVTYSSSDETVATVTADGTVTGHKASSTPVTITATAAGNDTYQSATASYTINVIDSSVTVKYYNKVTEITDGGIYLLVESGNAYAFDAIATSGYRVSVSPVNDKIEATDELKNAEITITTKSEKYFLYTTKGYLYNKSKEIGFNTTVDDKYLHSVSISNGVFTLKNQGTHTSERTLRYSSNTFQYSNSSGTFYLYLLEGSVKPSQTLSFTEPCVEWTLGYDYEIGESYDHQTVNGAMTSPVTYESSDTEVATISNGKVTILKAGTTTITATAPETEEYQEGTTSYTLEIIDPNAVNTYEKIKSAPSGFSGEYIFVYESSATSGKAMKFQLTTTPPTNTTTYIKEGNAVDVVINEGRITMPQNNNYCRVELVLNSSSAYYIKAIQENYYMRIKELSIATDSNNNIAKGYSSTFTFKDDKTVQMYRSSDGVYLYYDTTNNWFYSTKTQISNICLYKLVSE